MSLPATVLISLNGKDLNIFITKEYYYIQCLLFDGSTTHPLVHPLSPFYSIICLSPVAFVEFESSECAGRALDTNNGCLMRNKPLFVEFAKEKRPRTDISQPAQRDNLPLEKRMKGADPSRERVKIATLEVMGIPGEHIRLSIFNKAFSHISFYLITI